MTQRLELTRPDDWHLHLRDGTVLADTVAATAAVFGRAIVMPNLKPPVTTVQEALAYRERILAVLPEGSSFEPLMTLYLTPQTTPKQIEQAAACPHVHGVKLYPAGATTNADAGVADLGGVVRVLAAMQDCDVPLLVHGESIDPLSDVFDREALFISQTLVGLVDDFPELRIVFEHITTEDAVQFVVQSSPKVAATITAHHLLLNRNAMFAGGIIPHHYCLPILKRERHRRALVAAATSGNPKFFLGTDSAPHARGAKESACGCAGIFTAHAALGLYAEVFEAADQLEHFEGFASHHGPDFYGLPRSTETIILEREQEPVPDTFRFGDDTVVPLRAGSVVNWRVAQPPKVLTSEDRG